MMSDERVEYAEEVGGDRSLQLPTPYMSAVISTKGFLLPKRRG